VSFFPFGEGRFDEKRSPSVRKKKGVLPRRSLSTRISMDPLRENSADRLPHPMRKTKIRSGQVVIYNVR
jgi:hypothetical protein